MTDTFAVRRPPDLIDDRLRRPMALLEAIEIDELIVIPGIDALLDAPGEFSLSFDASIRLSGVLRKHAHRVGVMKRMIIDHLDETGCGADHLMRVPLSLPVRGLHCIVDDPRWRDRPTELAAVRAAFAFVAVHALTDPTDCGTASRSLTLRPRPLHEERALLRSVVATAAPGLHDSVGRALMLHVRKASAFFAVPDTARVVAAGGRTDLSSLLAYNPDALREACREIGWNERSVRIVPRGGTGTGSGSG
ncbi:hypothetical protein ACWDTI_16075 [Gordonia sp. NPDC003424]